MRKLIQFNPSEVLSTSVLALFKGGKRSSAVYQTAEAAIMAKAGRKVERRLGSQSGSISFFYEGNSYTATYDTTSKMLHITGVNGLDICVEW